MASLQRARRERGEYIEELDNDSILELLYEALDDLDDAEQKLATMVFAVREATEALEWSADTKAEFDRGFNEASE